MRLAFDLDIETCLARSERSLMGYLHFEAYRSFRDRLCHEAAFGLIRESEAADDTDREQLDLIHGKEWA